MSLNSILDILTGWLLPCALFLAGIIYAAKHRQRHPRVSLIVIIACGTMLGLRFQLLGYAALYSGHMILTMIPYFMEKLCLIALAFAAIMGRRAPAADPEHRRTRS
jgi:uncharacterized membrane protein